MPITDPDTRARLGRLLDAVEPLLAG
jgi:hypothetical protein